MKKYAGLMGLVALATLPACSQQYDQNRYGRNDNYRSGYTQDNQDNYDYGSRQNVRGPREQEMMSENNENNEASSDMSRGDWHNRGDGNHGDWKERKERKMRAVADYFFAQADTNHNGYITRAEHEAFARRMFRKADTNHDGKLSRAEVMAQQHQEMDKMHEDMMRKWGKDWDRDDMRGSSDMGSGSNMHSEGISDDRY